MAGAAVSFLLQQVVKVMKEHKDLISGAEHEFKQLENDLAFFKAFLEDAATKKKKENLNLFRKLEKRIQDAVYDIEEAIDVCLTTAVNKNRYNFKSRFTLARKVKDIRKKKVSRIHEDAKDTLNSIMLIISHGSAAVHLPTITQLKRPQNQIVGFEDEERTITEYLMEKTTEVLDVISIIGIPGQGKTTLAWKIYQNEDIDRHFPVRIWVYISHKLSTRDVFLQILRKFATSQDTSSLSDDELVHTVRACLETEKFLLVLDDVWSVDAWNEIKQVLPLQNGKGTVLITSREKKVGTQACSVNRKPHVLRFLTGKESWTLLQYVVFGNISEEIPHEYLRGIGKVIASKCDGVPLTTVVIGGILGDRLTRSQPEGKAEKEYWEMVSKRVSEALALLNYKAAERVIEVVGLSYDRLPYDLRDCFVYLGVFPQDYEIPVKKLCYMWIAEGFIQIKDDKKSLEEHAHENLDDLISRNLLKVDKTNPMGEAKTCRVPDMIRAFCIIKSKEQDFFHEIKQPNTESVPEAQQLRRVCCHSDLSSFLSTAPNCSQARSLLCFYKQRVQLNPKYISAIRKGFPKLRILESMSINFHQFPAKVSKLIHLRYLTLNIETLTILPKAISQLWNLQTIIVETGMRSITMKANIWNMIQLRHLKTKAAIVLDSKWKGEAGQNLQTLDRLSPESCTESFFQRARNLKTLGISGKLANFIETKFLENLKHLENLKDLEKLKLVNSLTYEPTSEDSLQSFSEWKCFPPSLKKLTLANTFLSWKHMSVLAKIRTLEVLKLKDNAFTGVLWEYEEYSMTFPNLQLLLIANADFVYWEASSSTFPSLRYLVVRNCEKLQEIPECLGTHLQKLEIERVQESAVDSARKIGEAKMRERKEFELKLGPVAVTVAPPHGKGPTYFKYDFTRQQPTDLIYQRDAHFTTNPRAALRLTATDASGTIPQGYSIGRVVHTTPVTMYERGRLASFVSTIRFLITSYSGVLGPADGLAFFITPVGYPVGKVGGSFGVFDSMIPNEPILAVAFDTFSFDGPSFSHVEIDIGSQVSKSEMKVGDALVGQVVHAWITYDATTKLISVYGTAGSTNFKMEYEADLSTLFPHKVQVGISAATGQYVALHDVLSWSFSLLN